MEDDQITDQVRERLLRGETIDNPVIRPGDAENYALWNRIIQLEQRIDALEQGSTFTIAKDG